VTEQPGNLAAVGVLVELYAEKDREPEAGRLIDAARAAVADDADHLYQVAHLYTRADQRSAMEDTLRQALAVDPNHPPASNDLGYGWAERGENLREAEALIRRAVEAEPDNVSFVDSLGWVLYKRGKLAEARPHLERAAGDGVSADPVVLDHLGDLLYRLGDPEAAARNWGRAAAKLIEAPPDRDDLSRLKLQLNRKAEQLKAGQPVTVSPVVEEPAQAKN
jgi:Tfp pilus assembly protein PilF